MAFLHHQPSQSRHFEPCPHIWVGNLFSVRRLNVILFEHRQIWPAIPLDNHLEAQIIAETVARLVLHYGILSSCQ